MNNKIIMDTWIRRMDGIAGKDRVGAQAFFAKELWENNPNFHQFFLQSAIEYGVVHFEADYQPMEPTSRTYPGCASSTVLTDAVLLGVSVIEILTADQVAAIEEDLHEKKEEGII